MATLESMQDTLTKNMKLARQQLPEYGGKGEEYTPAQVTSIRAVMNKTKSLLNDTLAFKSHFEKAKQAGTVNVEGRDQSTATVHGQINQMRKVNPDEEGKPR